MYFLYIYVFIYDILQITLRANISIIIKVFFFFFVYRTFLRSVDPKILDRVEILSCPYNDPCEVTYEELIN